MTTVNFNTHPLTYRTARETVSVKLYDGYASDVPKTLVGLIDWAKSLLEGVPPEYKSSADFNFTSGYDGDPDEVQCSWSRSETDAEWQLRIQGYVEDAIHAARTAEAQEKTLLKALQKKYGDQK